MKAPFRLEVLSDDHNRQGFACGQEPLDRYIRMQATQDIRRRISACFVAVESASGQLAAYYTLAAGSISTPDLPVEITKKLPRYSTLPAVRIGRLAVDLTFQGRGLGGSMLADPLSRVLVSPPAVFALLVDAKDDQAVAFYLHHGFMPLLSQPRTLFLPVATAQKLFLGK